MVTSRLDACFRVGPSTDTLTITHSVGGGPTSLTLSHGVYTLADLCAEVETQLQTVDADMMCSETDGVVDVYDSATDTFSVTWDHPGLRDWLGFSAGLSGAARYTGDTSPGTWVGSLPWERLALGYRWYLLDWIGQHQTGGALKQGKVSFWRVNAWFSFDELPQARSVLSHALRGVKLRYWPDDTVNTAWGYTNRNGYIDGYLSPAMTGIAQEWLNTPNVTLTGRLPLEMVTA